MQDLEGGIDYEAVLRQYDPRFVNYKTSLRQALNGSIDLTQFDNVFGKIWDRKVLLKQLYYFLAVDDIYTARRMLIENAKVLTREDAAKIRDAYLRSMPVREAQRRVTGCAGRSSSVSQVGRGAGKGAGAAAASRCVRYDVMAMTRSRRTFEPIQPAALKRDGPCSSSPLPAGCPRKRRSRSTRRKRCAKPVRMHVCVCSFL
eukprot:GHVU01105727.1.p1 GENE.GHVU01105727.1~~GHVU01105727.1.p1  ORF type:complete len:202 (+),score=25.30 GHVU01105727.1:1534-2139(+)